MEESKKGNPATTAGSEGSFFEELERQVNGGVSDNSAEVTHQVNSGSEQVTHNTTPDGSSNAIQQPQQVDSKPDYETRYKSSSREAVKLKRQLNELKPFVPVLNAMKKDSGLVDHVRNYFTEGGKPSKSLKEKLGLGDDFVFDPNEAMDDPKSSSAKLMAAQVDGMVQQRVNQAMKGQQQKSRAMGMALNKKKEAEAFKQKYNMDTNMFTEFMNRAKSHQMTLDDVYLVLNKQKAAANTAQSTRQDMLNQMKNVRNIPATASGANSQTPKANPDDDIFDGLLRTGGDVDNLFGE